MMAILCQSRCLGPTLDKLIHFVERGNRQRTPAAVAWPLLQRQMGVLDKAHPATMTADRAAINWAEEGGSLPLPFRWRFEDAVSG
jgi:hypothetical protein